MKRFKVEWSRPASIDLLNVIEYISQENIDTAIRIFEPIKSRCKTLKRSPERGRVVPELKAYGIFSYRELIVSPWRIIYKISDQKVFILAVIDSRRNIEDILIERFIE
jgi:plasmid stabilization system protein ParE